MRTESIPLCALGGASASDVSTAIRTPFAGASVIEYLFPTATAAFPASAGAVAALSGVALPAHPAHCAGRSAFHAAQPGGGLSPAGCATTLVTVAHTITPRAIAAIRFMAMTPSECPGRKFVIYDLT